MKSNHFLPLSIGVLAGSILFSANSNAVTTEPVANAPITAEQAQSQKDGEILSVLVVLNKNEIAAAREAMKKSHNPAVKKYAQMLKKEHEKNLQQTLKLSKKLHIKPVDSATVMTMKEDGKKELAALTQLKGADFDKAYIGAMVKGHTDALKMIDDDLLKNVSNPAVKAQIEATRPHIAAHLEAGQAIQNTLN